MCPIAWEINFKTSKIIYISFLTKQFRNIDGMFRYPKEQQLNIFIQ